ncbi:nucleotidyltransferase family protein [[Mycobacterium] zoologicum]|uniref:hypothetical protein n=1 Tax=[Mycobacterium] zoologicum TaxID=2872311 RepID=UPI001CDA8BBE|nr:hypothetical protein [Mycolicibacter sp. MYC101]MEB3061604.1 hypothetical protein [Mycolicibacter sp. MYC101]
MDIDQRAPWSGRKLAQLGQSLVDDVDPPADCPSYEHVADWHSDLCSEVATTISSREWTSYLGEFDVSSRAKTIDTLRDKLRRQPHLHLNQVQDLAGVRVDLDCDLDQQTAFAEEIAQFFGAERAEIKDIRLAPHSGYRAVHVWLRLPAGRVEIQIRTRGQSAWANAYEQLGDFAGRHIRYGEPHEEPVIQQLVESLHEVSEGLAGLEEHIVQLTRTDARLRENVRVMAMLRQQPEFDAGDVTVEERGTAIHAVEDEPRRRAEYDKVISELRSQADGVVDGLKSIRRMLEEISE